MDETPYQFGYRQAFNSVDQVIPYDHTIFDKRLDKIAYTHGWDNGFADRKKRDSDGQN